MKLLHRAASIVHWLLHRTRAEQALDDELRSFVDMSADDKVRSGMSPSEARRLAQDVALAVQAALLAQTAPPAVFAAFCDSRLDGHWGHSFGSLGAGTDFAAIIARAQPR